MNTSAFEYLELIPTLLQKMETMEDRMTKFAPLLDNKKDVAKFLCVTPRTINNYIEQGYLKEGYHFYRKNAKVLVFIENAILEFRDNLSKGVVA